MDASVIDQEQLGGLAQAAGVDTVRVILEAFWQSTDELTALLCRSIEANDIDECAKAGHALKGSSANLGAALLAERARKIEDAARYGDMDTARDLLSGFTNDIAATRIAIDEMLAPYA